MATARWDSGRERAPPAPPGRPERRAPLPRLGLLRPLAACCMACRVGRKVQLARLGQNLAGWPVVAQLVG